MGRARIVVSTALVGAVLGQLTIGLGAARAADPVATDTDLFNVVATAVVNTNVEFTAAVTPPPDGGTYELRIDGVAVDTEPYAAGFTDLFWTPTATGTFDAQVLYSGTPAFAGSSSDEVQVEIIPPHVSSVTVTAIPNPVGRNGDVTFSATVLPNPGPGEIEWTVAGGSDAPDATTALNGSGVATWTTSFADAGSVGVWAKFTGNDDWSWRTSDMYSLGVSGDAVSVSVSVPGSPLPPGPVSANVTLTPNPGAGELRWKVCSSCGETGVTVDADGTTVVDLGTLPVDNYTLYVEYLGSGNFGPGSGQTTFKVADNSTTALVTDRTSAYQGELPVKLTATVSSIQDITGGTVTFFDNVGGNVVQLGPVAVDLTTHTAVYASSSLRLGSHSVTAKYNGQDLIRISTSSAVTFIVLADTAVHATFAPSASKFYAAKDGYRDTVTLAGVLSERASVTIKVINSAGTTKRTWSLGTLNPGAFGPSWNGRTAGGTKLPAGTYTVKAKFKDTKGFEKTITASVRLSWREVDWKTVTVTRYGEAGTYFIGEFGGAIYLSPDYPRGRILDSGAMISDCEECGLAAGQFMFSLVTTNVLDYRKLFITVRGHGFTDRENTGRTYLVNPATDDFGIWMTNPLFDEAGVTYSLPFSKSYLSPTKKVEAWTWMTQAQGDAYDLKFVQLTYSYAVWA